MQKRGRSDADRYFAGGKKDDKVIKQKEKAERERDSRMARLRDLRLAKEGSDAAGPAATGKPASVEETEAPDSPEAFTARLPRVHPHQS
jgi:hypothetical protein